MQVYEFKDYKLFLKKWISEQPKSGHGQLRKMAEHLRVSTTLLSQTLNTDKHLSLETASDLCEYLGLSEAETEYLLLLIDYARAGSYKLKKILEKKVEREQKFHAQIQNRVKKDKTLSSEEKMKFYSSWMYSAARQLTALDKIQTTKDISEYLGLPQYIVNEIINFLLECNLCLLENKKLTFGPQHTHVEKNSPFVFKHHQNWRIKGFEQMERNKDQDLFYTQPMTLSFSDAERIRLMLPGFIEEVRQIVSPSKSETLYCFNLDYFEI